MYKHLILSVLCGSTVLFLSGCISVGPDYEPPEAVPGNLTGLIEVLGFQKVIPLSQPLLISSMFSFAKAVWYLTGQEPTNNDKATHEEQDPAEKQKNLLDVIQLNQNRCVGVTF